MTLILTAITADAIVQVSDQRVTKGTAVHDDDSNKALVFQGENFGAAFAFTGLAEFKKSGTAQNITFYLTDRPFDGWTVETITNRIAEGLEGDFASLPYPVGNPYRALTVASAGYAAGVPFQGRITNCEDVYRRSISPQAKFQVFLESPVVPPLQLSAYGAIAALPIKLRWIRASLRRNYSKSDPGAVGRFLYNLIVEASHHHKYGYLINKTFTVVTVLPSGQVLDNVGRTDSKLLYTLPAVARDDGVLIGSRTVAYDNEAARLGREASVRSSRGLLTKLTDSEKRFLGYEAESLPDALAGMWNGRRDEGVGSIVRHFGTAQRLNELMRYHTDMRFLEKPVVVHITKGMLKPVKGYVINGLPGMLCPVLISQCALGVAHILSEEPVSAIEILVLTNVDQRLQSSGWAYPDVSVQLIKGLNDEVKRWLYRN